MKNKIGIQYFFLLLGLVFLASNCTLNQRKVAIQKTENKKTIIENTSIINAHNYLFFSSIQKKEKHLYRFHLETKEVEQIIFGNHYNSFSEPFSQNKLRYIQGTNGDFFYHELNLQSLESILLPSLENCQYLTNDDVPKISPDGKKMAFACEGVFIANAQGKQSQKVGTGNQIKWHPKKNIIFYSYGLSGKWMVVNYDLKTKKETIIFTYSNFLKFFDVSSDSEKILYAVQMDEHPYHYELYIYNYLTKEKEKIYYNDYGINRACWSADESKIYIAPRTGSKLGKLLEYEIVTKDTTLLMTSDTLMISEMGFLKY